MNPTVRIPLLGSHAFDIKLSSSNFSNIATFGSSQASSRDSLWNSSLPPSNLHNLQLNNRSGNSSPLIRPEILNSSIWQSPSPNSFSMDSRDRSYEPSPSRTFDSRSRSPSHGRKRKYSIDHRSRSPDYRRSNRNKRSRDRNVRSPIDYDRNSTRRRRPRSRSKDRNRRSKSSDRDVKSPMPINETKTIKSKFPEITKVMEDPVGVSLNPDRVKTPSWYELSPKSFEHQDKNQNYPDVVAPSVIENSSTNCNDDVNLDLQLPSDVSDYDFLKDDDVEFTVEEEINSNDSQSESNNVECQMTSNIKITFDDENGTFNDETSVKTSSKNYDMIDFTKLSTDNTCGEASKTLKSFEEIIKNCEETNEVETSTFVENSDEVSKNIDVGNFDEILAMEIVESSENVEKCEENAKNIIENVDQDTKTVVQIVEKKIESIEIDVKNLRNKKSKQSLTKIVRKPRRILKLEEKLLKIDNLKEFILNQPMICLERISDEILIKYGLLKDISNAKKDSPVAETSEKEVESKLTKNVESFLTSIKRDISPIVDEKKFTKTNSNQTVVDDKSMKVEQQKCSKKANSKQSSKSIETQPSVKAKVENSAKADVKKVDKQEKIYSYPKLMDLAAQIKKINEEKVSKDVWEKPKADEKVSKDFWDKPKGDEKVSKDFWEKPKVDEKVNESATSVTWTVEESSPSSNAECIPGLDIVTSSPSASYLNKFKIKKIDPKQKQANKFLNKNVSGETKPVPSGDYVSPLDKILDETKKFAASSQFKRRTNQPESKTSSKIQREEEEKRRDIEERRRTFEKNVAHQDEIANFAKEIVGVVKQSSSLTTPNSSSQLLNSSTGPNSASKYYNSSTTPLSPCASVSSGGGRSSASLGEFHSETKRYRGNDSSDHFSPSARTPFLDSDTSSRISRKEKELLASVPIVYDSVKTLSQNIPLLGQGSSDFIWDGPDFGFDDINPTTDDDLEARTKLLLDAFAASQQKKALLKPPLLTTAPQVSLSRDPLLPLPMGPKTPPPPLLPLPKSPPSVENRHRILLPDTPDLMSFLTRTPGNSSTAKKPSLLETPDLISLSTSNTKKPSLLPTPLLPSLPETSTNAEVPQFDTQKLIAMINPALLVNSNKPTTSSNKGNLTINDAHSYLLASCSAADLNELFDNEPVAPSSINVQNNSALNEFINEPNTETIDDELMDSIEAISRDESAMQAVLLEIFRGLSGQDDVASSSPSTSVMGHNSASTSVMGHNSPSTNVQSNNDVTQLKGILITLLNDSASILQTDLERRNKAECLMKVLDEMELLDSKNPIFLQCDLLAPIMIFAKEVIELSETASSST